MKKLLIPVAAVAAMLLASAAFAAPAMVGNSAKGKVLTDAKGMTLYTFAKDSKGKSACNGKCAENWPPLMVSAGEKGAKGYSKIKRATARCSGPTRASRSTPGRRTKRPATSPATASSTAPGTWRSRKAPRRHTTSCSSPAKAGDPVISRVAVDRNAD